MKILVFAKHVPDTEMVVKLSSGGQSLDQSNTKYVINPCDEYAIETALRTQEKFGGESVVVSLGGTNSQETLRKALAMGIDRAVLINTDEYSDTLDAHSVSYALAQVVAEEKPDIIFAGLNTTDEGAANIGPMVAEWSSMPSILNISKIDWENDGKSLRVEREVEGGLIEVYEATLPVLLAPHQNLNEPRFPSLPGIMKAKKKPLVEKKIQEVLGAETPRHQVLSYVLPPEKQPAKIFKGRPATEMVQEVVALLRSEAKAL